MFVSIFLVPLGIVVIAFGMRILNEAGRYCHKCGVGRWEVVDKKFIKKFTETRKISDGYYNSDNVSVTGTTSSGESVTGYASVTTGYTPATYETVTYEKFLYTYKCPKCGATKTKEIDHAVDRC